MFPRLCAVRWLLFLFCALPSLASAAFPPGPPGPSGPPGSPIRRIAVLVGANQAAGDRQSLRYAYRDADKMAHVLTQVGEFDPANVHVLRDPEPGEILALLDREIGRLRRQPQESLLFFYFSGHADQDAVYSQGQPLPLRELRDRLDDPAATVRIGFIDACRGGGWTRAKGLQSTAPFAINLPEPGLYNEGAAFLASSSGLENAHESEHLHGSFFTHHFAAGLLGAADQTGDGVISLNEAFEYAKELTIRDTATFARTPQHPSFELKLRGRQDLTLTHVLSSPNLVQVKQTQGPLEIIYLHAGLLVAELQPGRRDLRIALPVGKYLIRRRQGPAIYALEFEVDKDKELVLREQDLRLVSREQLATKGGAGKPAPYSSASTIERKMVELRQAFGLRYRDFSYNGIGLTSGADRSLAYIVSAVWGITDRLQWAIGTGAFAYRLGQRGRTEWLPWGGLTSWGLRYTADTGLTLGYGLGLGLDVRRWLSQNQSVFLGVSATSDGATGGTTLTPTTWRLRLGAGYGLTIRRMVTVNFSLVVEQNLLYDGRFAESGYQSPELDLTLRLGAVQSVALRPLPLIQVHLNNWISLDGYAGLAIRLRDGSMQEHYMLGATFLFF